MTPITVRRALPFDAGAIAAFLDAVARPADPVPAGALREWIAQGGLWHIAETDALIGLQLAEPRPRSAPRLCEVTTFVAAGARALAAGSALFAATRDAAREHGFRRMVAVVPRGNDAAAAYYQSRGFELPSCKSRLASMRGHANELVMEYRL